MTITTLIGYCIMKKYGVFNLSLSYQVTTRRFWGFWNKITTHSIGFAGYPTKAEALTSMRVLIGKSETIVNEENFDILGNLITNYRGT